jgi:hypothetical protein
MKIEAGEVVDGIQPTMMKPIAVPTGGSKGEGFKDATQG